MTERLQAAELALHLDVAKRWWLRHLPYSGEALRFVLETVASRTAYLIAVEGLLSDVLREFATDLGEELDPFLAGQVGHDAAVLFEELESEHLLRTVPRAPLLRPALLISARHHIAFDDALGIAIAEQSGSPLLIADPGLHQTLQAIVRERPTPVSRGSATCQAADSPRLPGTGGHG